MENKFMKEGKLPVNACRSWTILVLVAMQFITMNNCAQAQDDSLNYDESKVPAYILPEFISFR